MKKLLCLLLISTLLFTAMGCKKNDIMPKIQGKEVSMSHEKLSEKLDRFTFFRNEDKVLLRKTSGVFKMSYENEVYTYDFNNTSYLDLSNDDYWVDSRAKIENASSKYESKIMGFESTKAVYFEINVKNEVESDEEILSELPSVYNGKYTLDKKNNYSTDLEDIIDIAGFDLYLGIDSEDYFEQLKESLVLLSKYNYSKLKLYEKDNLFTINLVSDQKLFSNERLEVKEALADILGVDIEDDLTSIKLEYTIIFDRNDFKEGGISISYKTQSDDSDDFIEIKASNYANYGSHKTPTVIYRDYELIDSFDDIRK